MPREDAWPYDESPFHAGEQHVQEKLGVRDQSDYLAREFVRDHMPDQHRAFYAKLPWFTVGHVDAEGRVWASMLAGRPGFMTSPDARTLHIAARPLAGDPLGDDLEPGLARGLLGLEPVSRRRNRVNAHVISSTNAAFEVHVAQTFGNCPQHIQTRSLQWTHEADAPHALAAAEQLDVLDEHARRTIATADTFFVASASSSERTLPDRSQGADASHRGGLPGVVRVGADDVLTIPDYSGNSHNNTLGTLCRILAVACCSSILTPAIC